MHRSLSLSVKSSSKFTHDLQRDTDINWDSAALELCHSCDILCFVTPSKARDTSNQPIRQYCKAVNPTAQSISVCITSMWFDDDLIASIVGKLEGQEGQRMQGLNASDTSFQSKAIRLLTNGSIQTATPKIRLRNVVGKKTSGGYCTGSCTTEISPKSALNLKLNNESIFREAGCLSFQQSSNSAVWSLTMLSGSGVYVFSNDFTYFP